MKTTVPEHERTLKAQPFPVEEVRAAFEVRCRTGIRTMRYLGRTQTPVEMCAHAPKTLAPDSVAERTTEWITALVATGPAQTVPHERTADTLSQGLARLRDFAAAGDLDAVRAYGRLISEAVADLSELARADPETVRAWSSMAPVVPVLVGRNRGHKNDLADDLEAFAVGTNSALKVNPEKKRGGGTSNSNTPAVFLASALIDCMNHHSKAVGYYSEPIPKWLRLFCALGETATAAQWTEAAWEYLLDGTARHPEKYFWELGKGKAHAAAGGKRTADSNVRAEIKQSLGEAIARILR